MDPKVKRQAEFSFPVSVSAFMRLLQSGELRSKICYNAIVVIFVALPLTR